MSDKCDKVICPVCNREYSKDVIESHVNKCIFLKSENKVDASVKRNSPFDIDSNSSTRIKRTRINEDGSSSSGHVGALQKQNISEKNIENLIENITTPLAECMRPLNLEDIVGHKELFGHGSMLHSVLAKKKIPNMILWGPPGCGKTSIANVIANICKEQNSLRFVKLSAVMVGINDVKEVVKVAKNELQFKRHTILFMDEIHRFNKLQQDTFLPHVENGTITLVGATTENPSFSLNNALLSRCKVIVLQKLSTNDVVKILERAIMHNKMAVIVDDFNCKIDKTVKCLIESKSIEWLAEISDGDARIALGALELAIMSQAKVTANNRSPCHISLQNLKDGIKRTHMLYDRKGEEHYNIISAIQKSIRASDDNAALYWTTRALHAGEDPLYIARRLIRTACEDIGLGDPNAVVEAVACLHGCQHIGMPESDVLLAQCAVRLARAPKSTEVYHAMKKIQENLNNTKGPLPPVPLHLCNAPTKLMKELGYGEGYNRQHKKDSGLTYMPKGFEDLFNVDKERF